MRCPKCHYLSFEPEPRCRNCGFDLATHDADPVIKNTDDEGPLVDLDLRRPAAGDEKPASLGQMRPARDVDKPRPPAYRPPAPPRQPEPLDPIAARARSAAAVADPPRSQPGRPDFARQHGFRSEQRRGLPQPDHARPDLTRPDLTRRDVIRPDVTRPEVTRSDAGHSDLGRPDVARPVSRPEIARPAVTRPEAPRPEVARPPAHRPDPPRVDPPRVEQRPQRAPHTTSDLPLFLKRLPDPEPELVATEPVIAEPVVTKPAVVEPLEPEPVVSKAPAPEPVVRDPIIERAPLAEPADVEIDRPLVKVSAVAREPLSVRRPAETTKPRSVEPEIVLKKDPSADRDLLAGMKLFDSEEFEPPVVYRPESRAVGDSPSEPAGPIGRTIAAVLDTGFLAVVGSAVLWITMRVCGLTMSDLPALPALVALPLFAFVLLIDLGYLLLFTAAGGQTLGKMAAGIRVVATSPGTGADERLDIQRAVFRSFVTLPSVLALGAGFLPALVGERRAVHDRIAQTRVVRA